MYIYMYIFIIYTQTWRHNVSIWHPRHRHEARHEVVGRAAQCQQGGPKQGIGHPVSRSLLIKHWLIHQQFNNGIYVE